MEYDLCKLLYYVSFTGMQKNFTLRCVDCYCLKRYFNNVKYKTHVCYIVLIRHGHHGKIHVALTVLTEERKKLTRFAYSGSSMV